MNSQDFVGALKKFFIPETVAAFTKRAYNPSKLSPERISQLSYWLNSMTADDAGKIIELIGECVDFTVFSVLVVIDNCDAIDDSGGEFELYHVSDQDRVRLGSPPDYLHDLL